MVLVEQLVADVNRRLFAVMTYFGAHGSLAGARKA